MSVTLTEICVRYLPHLTWSSNTRNVQSTFRVLLEVLCEMALQAVEWGSMDWIDLAQDTDRWRDLVNVVMNIRFPQNAKNLLTSWRAVSFSRRILLHIVNLVS
jgi:hypothetical protein